MPAAAPLRGMFRCFRLENPEVRGEDMMFPKDHWTLQWKGLNLYSRDRVLKIASFEGSGYLGLVNCRTVLRRILYSFQSISSKQCASGRLFPDFARMQFDCG